jgi:signal transduction histidine kinase
VTFRSLRWRIATFYALLLLGVIAVVAIVLMLQLRAILFDEARAKVDRVGADIAALARGTSTLSAVGDALPIQEALTAAGSLDHWSGPTTYVEVDTPTGYAVAKSTNMGGASFEPSTAARSSPVLYRTELRPPLGDVLVRDEYLATPGLALIVKVGESLTIYDETLDRIRALLALVVVLAALVVVAGSYAVASSAVEPIGRLIAAMGEIRSDRLSRRLGWSDRRDELGTLANSFDAMLERLEDGFARERQFISDASHELKTPLTVINANAQMLERWADRDPEIRAESLRAIREESASLAALVNGMLLLAKAESGDDMPREPVSLTAVVADAVRATRPRADEKGLALAFAPPPERDPLVRGDANLLRQLVTNLIDNAIKFTERGAIDVTLTGDGRDAVVTVLDTGVGIDEAALDHVFDRFYRADASRNRAIPGTGLGLAIVRSIARVHGGNVSAERRPEGGTAFRVRLPTLIEPS